MNGFISNKSMQNFAGLINSTSGKRSTFSNYKTDKSTTYETLNLTK